MSDKKYPNKVNSEQNRDIGTMTRTNSKRLEGSEYIRQKRINPCPPGGSIR
jgi:hypothetical protein